MGCKDPYSQVAGCIIKFALGIYNKDRLVFSSYSAIKLNEIVGEVSSSKLPQNCSVLWQRLSFFSGLWQKPYFDSVHQQNFPSGNGVRAGGHQPWGGVANGFAETVHQEIERVHTEAPQVAVALASHPESSARDPTDKIIRRRGLIRARKCHQIQTFRDIEILHPKI